MADTDILNPRILMHEARKADNPHGCTVFSGFFEPFLYPKTGVSYIWPGGVRISLPNAPIWPQWTALENVMKCDGIWTKFYSFYLLYNEHQDLFSYFTCFVSYNLKPESCDSSFISCSSISLLCRKKLICPDETGLLFPHTKITQGLNM